MSINITFGGDERFDLSLQEEEPPISAEFGEYQEVPVIGPPGPKGDPGDDGISPTVAVTEITGGHTVTITDADGAHAFDVMDGAIGPAGPQGAAGPKGDTGATGATGPQGETGPSGADGADGHSPVVTASKSGKSTTVYVDGSSIATIDDGADGADGAAGADGADGHSPVITATKTSGVTTIYSDGTAIATVNDGEDGAPGATGPQGETGPQGPAGTTDYNDLTNKPTIPTKTSDLTNDAGYITGMYIASYGASTWQDVLAAYNANKVVYCRASSNANPGTGVQGRMAFLAYVGFSGNNPSSFEFQYYRSVSSHSDSQQGDQVFIYTLKSTGWTVATREAYTKIVAGTGLTSTYSNGVLTIKLA